MQIANELSKYNLVPLRFLQGGVAKNQAAEPMNTAEAGAAALAVTSYTMPWPGYMFAVSADLSAAASAGTLAIAPSIGGVAVSDPVLAITTQSAASDTVKGRESVPFAKNALIGAQLTTNGDWNAEASDLQVTLWVVLTVSGSGI